IWQVVGADAVHILAYLLTDPDVIAFYSPNVLFGGTDGTGGAVGNGAQKIAGYLAQNYRLQINLEEDLAEAILQDNITAVEILHRLVPFSYSDDPSLERAITISSNQVADYLLRDVGYQPYLEHYREIAIDNHNDQIKDY